MRWYKMLVFVVFTPGLFAVNIAKLQMACDIGNEKACQKLQKLKDANTHTNSSQKGIRKSEDEYDKLICDKKVLKKYPRINRKYLSVTWLELKKDTDIYRWQKMGFSPLDARRWMDMWIQPQNIKSLQDVGVNSPLEAKKWICEGVAKNNNPYELIYIIKDFRDNGIETADEYIAYKKAKEEEKKLNTVTLPQIKTTDNTSSNRSPASDKKDRPVKMKYPEDEYDKLICDEKVVKRYPNINKKHSFPSWLDIGEYEREKWKSLVSTPRTAARWRDMKYSLEDVMKVRKYGIKTPLEAKKWICGGVDLSRNDNILYIIKHDLTIRDFSAWHKFGIRGYKAIEWMKAGIDSPEIAKSWTDAGLASARQLTEWKALGVKKPNRLKQWIQVGVTSPKILKEWLSVGVSDPLIAKKWIHLIKEPKPDSYMSSRKKSKEEIQDYYVSQIQKWKKDTGITDPEYASAWIESGFNIGGVKKWRQIIDDPYTAKYWKDSDIWNPDLWAKEGFTLDEAKRWTKAGVLDGYKYRRKGITRLEDALKEQNCKQMMSYGIFNKLESGLLLGKIIQTMPSGYLVMAYYNELYFVPKFDDELRARNSTIQWRVRGTGRTYTYDSVGGGVMQAAIVSRIDKSEDECAKYVTQIN